MSHGMSEEIKRLHRLLDRKDSGADEPIITNEKVIADLRDELKKVRAENEALVAVLREVAECSEYWSEYDVPLGLHDRIKAALAKAGAQC